MEDPTGLNLSISSRVCRTSRDPESTNLITIESHSRSTGQFVFVNCAAALVVFIKFTELPEGSDVNLVVLEVLQVERLHVEGCEGVVVLQEQKAK